MATSVTAFLAWKAYLIVARGSVNGPEKVQCGRLATLMLGKFDELWPTAAAFAKALKPLTVASAVELTDWYADPSLPAKTIDKRVRWAKRSIASVNAAVERQARGDALAEELADHAYAIRSAVLAHGAIHSTGNRFQVIVPLFEEFTSRIACAGYADRAEISLQDAFEECRVVT